MQLPATSKIAEATATKNKLSQRSSKPPWPGNNVPESLNPTLRLMRLSAKSPSTPHRPLTTPNTRAMGMDRFTPGMSVNNHQNRADPAKPAKKPSQLFFGETRGASLCLPNLLPTRYANESFAHTLKKMPSTSTPPQGCGSA